MEFGILGPLAVWRDGRELPLGSPKQRALLCVLVLRANEVVATARLVDELWGERPPATAVKTVQVYVSQLRKLLGETVIETRPTGYRLSIEPGALDLERFERLFERGRRLLAEGAAAEAGDALAEALGLWRGPPLADFELEAFARNEIARLDGLRLACVELRLQVELALGHHSELLGELTGLVGERPLQESLRALLMLALYRAGRQADALAVYQEGRVELVEGLGLEPSEALQLLEQQILRHDPSLDLGAPTPAAAPAPAAAGAVAHVAVPVVEARKVVTVVFCDADGPTDPEALRRLLERALEPMTAAVSRHGGTVEKTAAGGLMALFGVPKVHEDDALRALRAATEIRDLLPSQGLQARIGVQSGEVITGGDGPVTGVAVALAKRLEEAAAPGEVLIGELTLALTARAANVEPAEPLQLRSNTQPLPTFRLVGVHDVPEPAHRMRFVGREPELALIRTAWERSQEGECCELVTIIGDAGVGKSRLTAEALAPLDTRILRGRCLPYGDGITYWPVIEVLNQLNLEPPQEASAPIRALLGQTHTDTSAGEIAWAFRKTLEHAAAEQPLIVVFDDIHSGEETFLDLVEHVALLSSGAAILLVCIARPELLERRPAWPGTHRLEPLTDTNIDELIPARVPSRLREKIARAAGGNPLFIEEMVAIAGDADGELAVPPTLQAVLAARLDQLDPGERAVLTYGAVEGETFHHGAVQALAPDGQDVAARLTGLVRKGLIRPGRADLPGEDGYRFRHILIRDAAYDALPKATRAQWHERYANWLDQHGADLVQREELVGYHLEQSFRWRTELGNTDDETNALGERAAVHLAAAGRRAADRGDYPAAANLLQRALELGIADERERVRVQLELADLFAEIVQPERVRTLVRDALDAANRIGDRGLAAHARLHDMSSYPFPGWTYDEEAPTTPEEDIAIFAALGDDRGLAKARVRLAHTLNKSGRMAAACAELERALDSADAARQPFLRSQITVLLLQMLCDGPAPVAEVMGRCEELRRSSVGQPLLEAAIEGALFMICAMAAREDEARSYDRRSSEMLDEFSYQMLAPIRRKRAEAHLLLGDADRAEQHLLALWRDFGETGGISRATMQGAHILALLCCDQGRWEEAENWLARGSEDPPAPPGSFIGITRPAVMARLAAQHGELEEALELARRAVEAGEHADRLNAAATAWLALAEVRRARGETAEADAAVAAALQVYERKGNVAAAARVRASARPALS